ncbi:MAG: hypothetical protein DRJ01_14040 [Bacteroidetes bacterium]|nr:MAG: hypothetical protein DRJ01_14040 [Bacteroidota bacterium]
MFGIIPQGYFQTFAVGSFEVISNLFPKLEMSAEAMAFKAYIFCFITTKKKPGFPGNIFRMVNHLFEFA